MSSDRLNESRSGVRIVAPCTTARARSSESVVGSRCPAGGGWSIYCCHIQSEPTVETCPNCGAPLELDKSGRCAYCNVVVTLAEPVATAAFDQVAKWCLVPEDVSEADLAPFVFLIVVTLGEVGLSGFQAVRDFVDGQPGLGDMARQLSRAVCVAGARVVDAGLLIDRFDERLSVYTPDEIWTFNLALDLIAMLFYESFGAGAHGSLEQNLHMLDETRRTKTWRRMLKRASAGPDTLRELRAKVPLRT